MHCNANTRPLEPARVCAITAVGLGEGVGGALELSFAGTGIEVLCEKASGLGEFDVFVDGQARGTVSLAMDNFPPLAGVTVFSAPALAPGKHLLRLVNRSLTSMVVDAVRIDHTQ